MEVSQSMTHPLRWVALRSSPGPSVVNLPADYWG
jgi:hypothetical protein